MTSKARRTDALSANKKPQPTSIDDEAEDLEAFYLKLKQKALEKKTK
jgi:hypothetical protein